ncbi:MAG: hypothetical protein DLM67_19540 [Candidatus Nephthysia bennettiae]|nr:MAG: hypothetical protein DLM67_19540 [Candidatus Dormibacteraeota bacterium]
MLVIALRSLLLGSRIASYIRIVDLDRFFTWCLIATGWWRPVSLGRLLLGVMPLWPFRSIPTFVDGAHISSPMSNLEGGNTDQG